MASFWDTITGSAGADAANAAAADQYRKQMAAADSSRAAGNDYLSGILGISRNYDPYVTGGTRAQNTLYDLLGLNGADAQSTAFSNFRADPGYGYQVSEGIKAVDNSAASRGTLQSGATLKALQDRGANLADQSYGNYLQRLMALGQQGLQATGAQTGVQQQGYTGRLGANLQGAQQQYGAAPTIGQGMVAGANAEAAGWGNLLNTGTNLLGRFIGSGGLGGSSFSSPTAGGNVSTFMQGGQSFPMFT